MVIDTSALIAILLGEPEEVAFAELMAEVPVLLLSAASYLEAAMVIDRRGNGAHPARLDEVLADLEIRVEAVTAEQARVARRAFRENGKGVHPAGLNFGDCFSYALAKVRNEKLLFKGNDFSKTDLEPAVTPLP